MAGNHWTLLDLVFQRCLEFNATSIGTLEINEKRYDDVYEQESSPFSHNRPYLLSTPASVKRATDSRVSDIHIQVCVLLTIIDESFICAYVNSVMYF